MIARNETIFKWLLYAAATALCLFVQTALLQRVTLWGVIPVLYPLLAAIPATYEGPLAGTIFSLCVGVVCDLLLPGPVPFVHTLIFPLAGLCAGLLSQSLLPAGFLCSFAAAAAAFLLTDGFRCLLLWMRGSAAWEAGALLTALELCAAAPFVIPVTLLYRSVYRRTRRDD
ncbi:hypothetical protein [uncultured Oscillibacter sp.]|uniref:hypothetical protein n=1 Tax=uncultured Oscillibacter sp. TaxID=876091 RepID=UPI002614B2D7|nr:hypothetical protein [uncultured Oscillibacter sp.]